MTAEQVALKDIAKDIEGKMTSEDHRNCEWWYITPSRLRKERKLNKRVL